jgi:hypothetical protein
VSETVSTVLGVVLGWFLGIFSKPLTDWVERKRRRTELISVIATELHELRFIVTLVWVDLLGRFRTMDQRTLDIVKPILLDFQASGDDRIIVEGTRKLLESGDEVYIAGINLPKPRSTPFPVTYEAAFLSSHLEDLGLFPLWQQQRLLRVTAELRLFNQQVDIVQRAFERTFLQGVNEITGKAITANLEEGYNKEMVRAEYLVRAIDAVLDSSGKTRRR